MIQQYGWRNLWKMSAFSVAHCFVVCITENVSCIEGMLIIRFSRQFHANVLLVSNEKL